jgi:hypothetical protein
LREPDWEYISLAPYTVTHEWDNGKSTTSHHVDLIKAVTTMQDKKADRRVVVDARGETVYGTNDDRWPITAVATREACDAWLTFFAGNEEGEICTLRVFEMIRESLQ